MGALLAMHRSGLAALLLDWPHGRVTLWRVMAAGMKTESPALHGVLKRQS